MDMHTTSLQDAGEPLPGSPKLPYLFWVKWAEGLVEVIRMTAIRTPKCLMVGQKFTQKQGVYRFSLSGGFSSSESDLNHAAAPSQVLPISSASWISNFAKIRSNKSPLQFLVLYLAEWKTAHRLTNSGEGQACAHDCRNIAQLENQMEGSSRVAWCNRKSKITQLSNND